MTTVPIVFPADSAEGTRAVVGRWLAAVGATVRAHQPILEIETDKTTMEIAAPCDGVLAEICKAPEAAVAADDVLGRIEAATVAVAAAPAAVAKAAAAGAAEADLAPAVRRLLRDHHLRPEQVRGTGGGGRITIADVERHLAAAAHGARRPAAAASAHADAPRDRGAHGRSVRFAPQVTAVHEADLSRVLAHREARKAALAATGVRLTTTAYLVVAAARALAEVPEVNSRWHDDALEVFEDLDIGIVTAIDGGLIVPVIRAAQRLDLDGAATALHELTEKARHGQLSARETRGSTFAITNHGTGGSLLATPIIHQPHSAILGIGRIQKRAVVLAGPAGDAIVARPMAYVTLTIDHRALDAASANGFLRAFTRALEEWA